VDLYLAAADADATAQTITDNGGSVLMPTMDVLTFGRMVVVADPTGAVFGLWQARDFIGSQVVNEPGSVIWSELNTADPDRRCGPTGCHVRRYQRDRAHARLNRRLTE
jgi:hypothetical protein